MPGPCCGNNPHFQMSPSDRVAVDEFRAYLAARTEEKKTLSDLDAARAALARFWFGPDFTASLERFEAAVRANERAGTEARRLGEPVEAPPAADPAAIVRRVDQDHTPVPNPPIDSRANASIDRVPIGRSVRYVVRGAPEVPDEYNETRTIAPTEVTLTYRATTDSALGRVHAYVKGWWMHEGARVHAEAVGRHFHGDLDSWPTWLATEARLHDPERSS